MMGIIVSCIYKQKSYIVRQQDITFNERHYGNGKPCGFPSFKNILDYKPKPDSIP
jgi:hypothetical protein